MSGSLPPLFWAFTTLAAYAMARALHRALPRWWTSPLLATWALCFALALGLRATYQEYLRGTGWLLTLLGPATLSFALPIYEQRRLIRRFWPVLAAGVATGSLIAFGSSWLFAWMLGLTPALRLSLLPRSVTTPFALAFVRNVGGVPELTATCVAITGVLGASLGDLVVNWLPLRTAFARGALFGMGAHAVGTARARQLGDLEGSVAGLTMILAGIVSVLAAPIVTLCLR